MNTRMLELGHSELMAHHQDLGILPPRLTARQTQHRHSPGNNQEVFGTHRFVYQRRSPPLGTPFRTGVTGFRWYRFPMEAVIDQAGRVVLPKPIRDALGLLPGTKVDITPYGAGAQLLPAGRTARLVEEDGVLVADAETPVDDDMVFALIDAGRK